MGEFGAAGALVSFDGVGARTAGGGDDPAACVAAGAGGVRAAEGGRRLLWPGATLQSQRGVSVRSWPQMGLSPGARAIQICRKGPSSGGLRGEEHRRSSQSRPGSRPVPARWSTDRLPTERMQGPHEAGRAAQWRRMPPAPWAGRGLRSRPLRRHRSPRPTQMPTDSGPPKGIPAPVTVSVMAVLIPFQRHGQTMRRSTFQHELLKVGVEHRQTLGPQHCIDVAVLPGR